MSLHLSVVAIEGNHLDELPDILRKCGYVLEKSFRVLSGEQAAQELDWHVTPDRVAKVAYFSEGWTFLVDPELVLLSNDVWLESSHRWNNRIFGWICEGVSDTYGLTLFDSGSKQRSLFVSDGEVVVDIGAPLAQEVNVEWSAITEEDVLEIARRLGAKYDFPADREYLVFHLDESLSGLSTE